MGKFIASDVEPDMPPLKTLNNDSVLNIVEAILKGYIKDYKRAVIKRDFKTPDINLNKCRIDLDDPLFESICEYLQITKTDIIKEVGDIEYLYRVQ